MGNIVQTGLGWYADEEYLTDDAGLIGNLSAGGTSDEYTVINGIYCDGIAGDAIDTGISPSQITQFEIVSLFSGTFSSEAWVFGSWRPDYGGHGPGIFQNMRQICWYPGGRYALPNADDTWLDITGDCISGIYKCNGITLTGNSMFLHANSSESAYLFGGNWAGQYMPTNSRMVLAYVKIVTNDDVRTYVSVERVVDGAVGMYEMTTHTFYMRGHKYTGAGGTAPIPPIPPITRSSSTEFFKLNNRAAISPILNSDTYTGTWNGHSQYAMAEEYDVYAFYVANQPYPGICYACVDHSPRVFYGYTDGYDTPWSQLNLNSQYHPAGSSSTVYYSYGTAGDGPYNLHTEFIWASLQAGLDALVTDRTVNYNKSTAGYSVTCFCKWITSYGGDVYFSPVLISSQPNNTLYTRNGSTPSVNVTEHQYRGMTFYMRKAPLDTLDGSETITTSYPIVDLSGVAQTNDTIFAAIAYQSSLGVGYIPGDEDPYAPGGTSEPSGGTPDFTEVSESISPGSTFPISFQSTGLCRVYVPSITDLNDLANYLWTDQTFLDTIKNILINQFENFMEAVISLTMVPCQVPKDAAQPVKVMFLSTGLSFPPATQQFVEVDCGYVDITERYASALDYNPYTKVSLYLPFIGTVPLDTDEVMGHRLKCVYTIDIVSGACVAKIMVNYSDSSNGVLYQFSGHCSISMPLTAADFSSYYAAAMSGLKMAAGLAAAGAGAPGLAGTLLGEPTAHPSSTTTTTRTTERNAATGRQILAGTESRETSHTPGQASFKELATRASVNTVGAVINSKFSVEHSGGFTGNTGFLGVQAPYVIITRPDMCNPDEYGAYNGRPSMMYLHLGNLSGFTQVQNIKLTGIPATNPELGEIAELLKTGVIL